MTNAKGEPGAARLILLGLIVVVLGGWAVGLYLWALLSFLPGAVAAVVFVGTLAAVGLLIVLDRMVLPSVFRWTLVDGYARRHGWQYTRDPKEAAELSSLEVPRHRQGSTLDINLAIKGEIAGRPFEVTQIRADAGSGDTANRSLSAHVWVGTFGDLPVDAVVFRPLRGTVTVRSQRFPELATAVERSDFARWMRRHRLLARTITVERGGVSATWRHGLYGAKLQRKLRFLIEASGLLGHTVSALGSPGSR
jgi:hypothetical protein